MLLSVIVPVYNEASTLSILLNRVHDVPLEKEILVVDDGSNNETKEQLEDATRGSISLITHEKNLGKGAAIQSALSQAVGDAVIIQDADLEYFPEDYVLLTREYTERNARAVYGVRNLANRSWLMRRGNHAMTLATNLLYKSDLADMETCYKLIDRQLFQSLQLKSKGFEIEAEITAKLLRLGIRIYEVPIRYEHREEGKKLTPWDGWPTLRKLVSCRSWQPDEHP